MYYIDLSSKPIRCSYCNKLIIEELWCNECDPHGMIEGWTSENPDIDRLIKDTIQSTRYYADNRIHYKLFLEWVPYNRFTDIEPIGEGGFAKVYSATWLDGRSLYCEYNGDVKKLDAKTIKVALKRLNGSKD